jgi:hypothetical protein
MTSGQKSTARTNIGAGSAADVATNAANITAQSQAIQKLEDEVGKVVNGNTCLLNISIGDYVIVKNSTITGITDGLYTANAAVGAGTAVVQANLTAVSGGGFNALNGNMTITTNEYNGYGGLTVLRQGKLRSIFFKSNGMTFPQTNAILDTQDRPQTLVRVPASTQTNSDCYWASINTNGKMNLYKAGYEVTETTNYVMFAAVYKVP